MIDSEIAQGARARHQEERRRRRLIDIGDGVACLEFHSKMNAIGGDTVSMMNYAVKEVGENFEALVIGNQGENFSVGANIMMLLLGIQEGEWDEIGMSVRQFQNANMSLRYSAKPVVVAPHGMALGGGCEITMHGDKARAAAETYIGLVEVGVGLIPAGGGVKEMVLRAVEDALPDEDLFPRIKKVSETIAMARVSTSAVEAREIGLSARDRSDHDEPRPPDRRRQADGACDGARRLRAAASSERIFRCWASPRWRRSSLRFT